jgi:hypothetical protein
MSDDAQNTRDLVQLGVSALDDLVGILLERSAFTLRHILRA